MKIKSENIKYVVVDKTNNSVTILRFKKQVADLIGVSVKTIYRNQTYENSRYIVYSKINQMSV